MQGSSDLTSLTANSCYFRSSKTISTSFFSLAFISSGPREAEEHACNTIAQRKKKRVAEDKKVRRPRSARRRGRGSGEALETVTKTSKSLSRLIHPSDRKKMVPSSFLMNFFIIYSLSLSFFFLFSERVLNVKGLDLQDSDQKDFFVQVFGGIKCSSQLNIWDCKKQNF